MQQLFKQKGMKIDNDVASSLSEAGSLGTLLLPQFPAEPLHGH